MKSFFATLPLLALLFTHALEGQSSFQPGYIVFENGQRENVSIYNLDWVDNPKRFRYRQEGNDETRIGTFATVAEFGLADGSLHYLRQVVNIDPSSSDPGELNTSVEPPFIRDTVFLEWLVIGRTDLFSWSDGSIKRFYFRNGAGEPEPLISRKYRDGNKIYSREHYFRGQLSRSLECKIIADNEFRELEYRRNDLIRLITAANACGDAPSMTTARSDEKNRFSLGIRPGLALYSGELTVPSFFGGGDVILMQNAQSARIGVEMEYYLPFASNRWRLYAEGAYQRYNTSGFGEADSPSVAIDHKVLELNLGVRRYVYFNEKVALFGQLMGAAKVPLQNSSLSYRRSATAPVIRLETTWNFAVGAGLGVSFDDRYQLAVEYLPSQNYLQTFRTQFTSVQSISVILCYRLN